MLWKKRYNFDKANEVVKQVQKMAQEKLDTFSKKCVTKQENKETATKSGAESEEKMDVTQDLPSKGASLGKKSDLSFFFFNMISWNLIYVYSEVCLIQHEHTVFLYTENCVMYIASWFQHMPRNEFST